MSVSFSFARRKGVVVGREAGIDEPLIFYRASTPVEALLEVQRSLGQAARYRRLADRDFEARLQSTFEQESGESARAIAEIGGELDLGALAEELREPADLLESADDAPIIRLINAVLTEAIRENASDIHIEPFEERLAIRLRVDGVLRQIFEPPVAIAGLIVSRVKIMAKLDIAEKRIPQDGRISLRVANRPVDVRVSTIPAGGGERVVMRLLDKQAGRLELEQIGMAADTMEKIDSIVRRPHGIFLVTGPTGSGKTTTLYSALSRINDRSRNIMTVEDPIEYFMDGIAQTQVNSKVDMSFARGLRAILRQDPDVVMVGEIRDLETAQIAIQASLTGHLVLSTLHTNTAVGAVARLRDMGTEPFLLSSSLVAVLAQRLVRVLCGVCKRPASPDARTMELLGADSGGQSGDASVFAPVGCERCNGIGYRGRTAIYELVMIDRPMRALIHDGAGEAELEQRARAQTASLRENALLRVTSGTTTPEEVLRVTMSN